MKIALSVIAAFILVGIGYLLGSQEGSEETSVVSTPRDSTRIVENTQIEEVKVENFYETKVTEKTRKKLTPEKKKEKMQEHFKYLLSRLPFSYVKKFYGKRQREIHKASFELFNKPDSKDFEAVKQYHEERFKTLKPIIDKNTYYVAEGTSIYKGFDIPYTFSISFMNPWRGNKTGKLEGPGDLDFMISLVFDTRSVGSGGERYVINSGSGVYDVFEYRGKTFLKSYVYANQKSNTFDDALFFLIEAPNNDGITTEVQLFDSVQNKWVTLSDQVIFKPVSKEKYEKVKRAAYIEVDESP